MNLYEHIKSVVKEETTTDKNLLGKRLRLCSTNPMTGYYRDGLCKTGDQDKGKHTVCATMSKEFLKFTKSKGNNLTKSSKNFEGLNPGDKWCVCAERWKEAYDAGVAPKVDQNATNIKTLDIIGDVIYDKPPNSKMEIQEKCWKGYTQKGMKTMFGKRYPNCVKKKVNENILKTSIIKIIKEETEDYDRKVMNFLLRRYETNEINIDEKIKFKEIYFKIEDEYYRLSEWDSKKRQIQKILNMLEENNVIEPVNNFSNQNDPYRQKIIKTIRKFLNDVM